MGEFADQLIDDAMLLEEDDDYFQGFKTRDVSPPLKCRRCNSTNVFWKKTRKGWRLYTEKEPHRCFNVKGQKK